MVVCYLFAILWCDDKFRMCDDKFCMKSFCRRPFFIMHGIMFVISNHAWWIVIISWRGSPQVQPAMCICIPKANYLYAHLQGEPLQLMKTIPYPLRFHIIYSPLKTSTSLSSITKKGEIVSASSATLVGFGVLMTNLVEGLMCLWELQDNTGRSPSLIRFFYQRWPLKM